MSRQCHCVQNSRVKGQSEKRRILRDKAYIEGGIVRYQAAALTEREELRQDHVNLRCRKHHVVVDPGQLLNLKRNRHIRVYKGAEFVRDHALFHLDRADLNDPVFLRAEAGGLDIKHHEGIRKGLSLRIFNQVLHIVYQIALHTVKHLKRIVLIQGVACLREGLHTAVVSDCQGLHPPLLGLFDDARHIRNTIHIAHLGMTVELHALHRTVIHTFAGEILCLFDAAHRTDGQFAVKPVDGCHAAEPDERPRLDRAIQIFQRILIGKDLDRNRIGKVRDMKDDDGLSAAQLPAVLIQNLAPHRYLTDLTLDFFNGDKVILKITAEQNIRIIGFPAVAAGAPVILLKLFFAAGSARRSSSSCCISCCLSFRISCRIFCRCLSCCTRICLPGAARGNGSRIPAAFTLLHSCHSPGCHALRLLPGLQLSLNRCLCTYWSYILVLHLHRQPAALMEYLFQHTL